MIDVSVRFSPGWWVKTLAEQLYERRFSKRWSPDLRNPDGVRPPLELLNDYYRNEPPLPKCAAGWGETTTQFLRLARMNYAALVTESVANRLMPVGWRTSADSDRDGDQLAKQIADKNQFPVKIGDAILGMLAFGDSYGIVGGPEDGSNIPVITTEDPREVITAQDPRTGRTLAGLKMYRDQWEEADFIYLYLPGRVYVAFVKAQTLQPLFGSQFNENTWSWDETRGGAAGAALPAALGDRVPVARFRNREGVGEFERHLSVLDRIHDGIFDRITIAKHQAHRQRGLKDMPGEYPDGHEKAGEPIEYDPNAFSADPGALWQLPPGVDVWESQTTDLNPIRMFIKDDVEALAAVTFTPLHYINPDAANGSAEGASTMREGHIFRTEDRMRRADAGLAELMSLAFLAMGDTARANGPIQTIWAPVERHSLIEKAQASVAAKTGGLPQQSNWTDVWGFAPADLPRLESERAGDLLFAPTTAPAGQ